MFELAWLARGEQARAQTDGQQEQALARDRVLLGVFYLAYNGWQIGDIVAHYELTRLQVFSLLQKLGWHRRTRPFAGRSGTHQSRIVICDCGVADQSSWPTGARWWGVSAT